MDYTQFDHIENWTVADIIDWHRVCFEKATLESQEDRVKEELDEYEDNKEVSELADCIISCCGISRFNIYLFLSTINYINSFILDDTPYTFKEVSKAINDKMKINLQRWKDGEWIWDEQTQQYKRGE